MPRILVSLVAIDLQRYRSSSLGYDQNMKTQLIMLPWWISVLFALGSMRAGAWILLSRSRAAFEEITGTGEGFIGCFYIL